MFGVRTQKAQGVLYLTQRDPFPEYLLLARGPIFNTVKVFPTRMSDYDLPLPAFARPCPKRPRHGFVESRLVMDLRDVLKVIGETLRADPEGEVVFMERFKSTWSGILTHAGVTFGLSNDGATSGAKGSVTIPAWVKPSTFKQRAALGLYKDVGIDNTLYAEFVENERRPIWVQLRDGPEVPRSANFIPKRTRVRKVLRTSDVMGDLLEWEQHVEENAKPGTVFWHPGGSLTSHFAVHAILHNVPVVVSDEEPEVGAVLEPEGDTPEPLTDTDYRILADLIHARFEQGFGECSFRTQQDIARTAVATLHASPQWGREPHLLRLRAEGVAAAMIYTAVACLGEARHWFCKGPGAHDKKLKPSTPWRDLDLRVNTNGHSGRDEVYERGFMLPVRDLAEVLPYVEKDLGHEDWRGNYGGRNWARAAGCAKIGLNSIIRFIKDPTADNWREVMENYNEVIHQVHNSGRILTKWLDSTAMDVTADCPGPTFVNTFAAEVVLGMDEAAHKVTLPRAA